MNDKELLEKLNRLKEIKLDSGWKSQAREVLFSQISNSVAAIDVPVEKKTIFWFRNFLNYSYRPASFAIGIFTLFILGVIGVQAGTKNIRPGNNLYAARILSERAQVAMTLDQEKKEKLNVKLASTRAKEITEVLSNTDLSKEENKKKAEKLTDAFKSEISTVKSGFENLNRIKEEKIAASSAEDSKTILADNNAVVATGTTDKNNDDEKVYAVESGKSDNGIQVYSPEKIDIISADNISTPTSSADIAIESSLLRETASSGNIDFKLGEAENSFVANDFAAAKQMLEQVNSLIDGMDDDKKIDNQSSEEESSSTISTPVAPTVSDVVASGTAEIK